MLPQEVLYTTDTPVKVRVLVQERTEMVHGTLQPRRWAVFLTDRGMISQRPLRGARDELHAVAIQDHPVHLVIPAWEMENGDILFAVLAQTSAGRHEEPFRPGYPGIPELERSRVHFYPLGDIVLAHAERTNGLDLTTDAELLLHQRIPSTLQSDLALEVENVIASLSRPARESSG